MASDKVDDSLYPIAVLIDELKNDDVQVSFGLFYCSTIENISIVKCVFVLTHKCAEGEVGGRSLKDSMLCVESRHSFR